MANNAEFARLCNSLPQKIQKIRSGTEQIRTLLGRLSSRADSDELLGKLQKHQHETKQLTTDTATMLSRLDSMSKDGDRNKRTQVERLREDVIRVTNEFQCVQRDLIKKEKEFLSQAKSNHLRLSGAPVSSNNVLIDVGGDLGLGPGSPSSGQYAEATAQAQLQAQAEAEEIEERERAMRELENDIVQVNELFRDFGMIVHEQGEAVDSIVDNIESTQMQVSAGVENLRKAKDSKSAVRKKKVIIAIIIVIVLAVLSVIIYFLAR